MEEFKVIYRILRILQKAMDVDEFDQGLISPTALGLSQQKWSRIMRMLLRNDYITGADTWESFDCPYPKVKLTRPEITLKGLEYLEDNSLMKKAAGIAKGVIDIVT